MYGKNADEIIEKLKLFYAGRGGTSVLQIRGIDECEDKTPQKPLNAWNFDTQLEEYLDERARRAMKYWENRADIDDILLPSITAWYGIAEHTAWLGGKVDFSTDTSYNHQIIDDIEDVDKLKIDPENVWFARVAGGMEYLRQNYEDKLFVKLRGADAPSDIANIVRGNELFYDVYDDPEAVSRLADFCADGMNYYFSRQQAAASKVADGVITGFDIWMPGNSVGQLSEDASCMMSVDMYREIFLDAFKKCVSPYDGVMLHTHSLGKQHLPTFAEVEKVKFIEISNDPNAERAIDVWREYKNVLRDKIVIVAPTFDELRSNADLLSENRSIIWYYAKTKDEAREVASFMKQFNKF